MANITPRQNKDGSTSYLIRVFVDENSTGKQLMRSMTWKPAPGMTPKQIDKELKRQEVLFSEKVKDGLAAVDNSITFEDYTRCWLEQSQIAPKTREQYNDCMRRIAPALGHIKLSKLQAQHLKAFYSNLREEGTRIRGNYATSDKLKAFMKNQRVTVPEMRRRTGLSTATIENARAGKHVAPESAHAIAQALNQPTEKLFLLHKDQRPLSDKTVLHHHRFIAAVLATAKRERIIPFNAATDHMNAPKLEAKEPQYLDDEQARSFLIALLDEQDIRIKTALILALYSGLRRGELCGLEWSDVDDKNRIIHVLRASQVQKGKGIVTVPTKNRNSKRAIKLPQIVFDILGEYRIWWDMQRLQNGDRWRGELQRLLIKTDGAPINPDTINYWLERFVKRNNLPRITPHGLRHTFATLQIAGGVDIRTLQARTGHAQASTLTNLYTHALKSAEAAAADVLDNLLTPQSYTKSKDGSDLNKT